MENAFSEPIAYARDNRCGAQRTGRIHPLNTTLRTSYKCIIQYCIPMQNIAHKSTRSYRRPACNITVNTASCGCFSANFNNNDIRPSDYRPLQRCTFTASKTKSNVRRINVKIHQIYTLHGGGRGYGFC